MKLKFLIKSQSIYTKLILSFLVVIMLLTIILTSSLYLNYEKAALDIAYQANLKLLSQISYSTSYMNELGISFCKSELLNSDILTIINSRTKDIFNLGSTVRKLESTIMPASYIHSAYIYNRQLDLYVSTYGSRIANSDSFFDKSIGSIIRMANNTADISQLVPIPRRLPVNSDRQKPQYTNVYTYILFDYASYTDNADKINGAIILNISQDWLKNTIISMNPSFNKTDDKIFIIDKNGTVVSHSSPDMFLSDLSSEEYIMKVLSEDKRFGYFIEIINKEKYVVTYAASGTLDWKFISLTPYTSIVGIVSKVRILTVILCFIILSLGLFISAYISKRIYLPINTLVNSINDKLHKPVISKKQLNEINFLSSAFKQVMDKAVSLEMLQQSNQQLLKNEFLKNLLTGSLAIMPTAISSKMFELGIRLAYDSQLILCILKIDSYRQFTENLNEKERTIYQFAICNIATEIVGNFFTNEIVDMGSGHICIILQLDKGFDQTYKQFSSILTDSIHQIQEHVCNYYKISLSAAAGYITDGIDKIGTSYSEVLNLSHYKIVFGHKSIVLPDNLNSLDDEDFTIPAAKEKQLLDSIRLGDADQAKDIYKNIITIISKYSYDNIMSSIVYLAVIIYNCISSIEKSSSCKFSIDFNTFNKNISSMETLDEINDIFISLFYEIASKLNESKSKKSDKIINNVVGIIQSNYHDKNLCMNSIASTMKMSYVYLGKIFKVSTSKSIAEFITECRMENVKYLLDTTNHTLSEILEKTGFEKSNYFYTAFKKHFGVSLSEYKLSKSIEKDT